MLGYINKLKGELMAAGITAHLAKTPYKCNTTIPYYQQFKSWQFHFWSSPPLMALEGSGEFKSLGIYTNMDDLNEAPRS